MNSITRGREDAPLTVLFLHGASYGARTWAERGVLDRVSAGGYRGVAVDLPGYGDSPDIAGADIDPATFLAKLIDSVERADQVVLVSPSMSGRYSLALLAQRPELGLAGFVAVAPAGIDTFDRPPAAPVIPSLLVWGADDDVIPRDQADELLAELPGSRLEVIPSAGHAPYDDQPDAFSDVLLTFLRRL